MRQDYYVYVFLRKDYYTPYYVGKGCRRRCYVRRTSGFFPPTDKTRIRKIRENLTETEAFLLEKTLIKFWGRKTEGGVLVNKTEGGEGTSGHKHSPRTRKLMSLRHKENTDRVYNNRKLTDKTKNKIRESLQKHYQTTLAPNSKPFTYQGTTYSSVKECYRSLGIPKSTFYKRLNEGRLFHTPVEN